MGLLDRLIEVGTLRGLWRAEQSPLRSLAGIEESFQHIEAAVLDNHLMELEKWKTLRSVVESDVATLPGIARGLFAEGESAERLALGRYQLLERIGSGGSGEVFRAIDRELRRVVAVKRISTDSQIRFLREAQATARLHHPHIVPIHDMGEEGSSCYLVLQFISGPNLRTWREKRPSDWKETARILQEAAEAIAHAHTNHILHRDVKPENILVDEQAQAFVTDFGLARETDRATWITMQGAIMGTPAFMSPEQTEGGRLDERTDVYSLGATLYFLLTGRGPFEVGNIEMVLRKVRLHDPPPPRIIDPSIPRALETICLKAMAKEKNRRYASATELAEDLARFQKDEPIHAHPTSTFTRLLLRMKRRPAIPVLTTVLSLLVVAGVCAAFYLQGLSQRKERAAPHVSAARRSVEQAEVKRYREGEMARATELADGAIASAQEALKLDPESVDARVLVGRAWAIKSDLPKAEEHFREASRRAPDLPDAYIPWARLLVEHYFQRHVRLNSVYDTMGRPPTLEIRKAGEDAELRGKALPVLANVTSLGLENEKAWSLAMTAFLAGNYRDALERFRELEPHLKTDLEGLSAYALCLIATGDLEGAHAKAAAALEASRFFPDLFVLRGHIREALGKFSEAEEDYTSALRLDPKNAELYGYRGLLRELQSRNREALEDYLRVTELAPNDPNGWFASGLASMGLALSEGLERLNDAIGYFTRATDFTTFPKVRMAWLLRGKCHYGLRHYREAVRDWEKAIQLDPTLEEGIRFQLEDARGRAW